MGGKRTLKGKEAEEFIRKHREWKGERRKRDMARIASGEITPKELQRENFGLPREAVQNATISWPAKYDIPPVEEENS